MNNPQIARVFDEIADILEVLNDNPFRVRSYRRAASTLEGYPQEIRDLDESGWTEIPGIGKDLAAKIKEILTTGKIQLHEELSKKVPPELRAMMDVPGLGPKTVTRLWDELGIKSMDELETAARSGRIKGMKGLGAKVEANILKGIEQARRFKARPGIGKVLPVAHEIVAILQKRAPLTCIDIAGSIRRMRETAGDIDILVTSVEPEKVMEAFAGLSMVDQVLARGETKSSVLMKDGLQCDLRVVEEQAYGAALHYFTGSKGHNIRMRQIAQEKGLKLNEYGVFKGEQRIAGKNEEEIFAALGLPYIPPEIREDRGEIEAALAGKLPRLVEFEQIAGDLHMHTTWSDGKLPLEEMVAAASKRYKYAAITDHSKLVGVTRGMDEPTLLRQVETIRELAKSYADFKILCGIEVDIHPDGTLDMTEKGLAALDIVVASVHVKFNMSEEDMTNRMIRAIENPYVTVIAHPTGRLINYREPYPIDMEKVLEAAKRTGTFMELNSFSDRLDLNDVHLRMAKEKGVKILIDTDSHNSVNFEMLRFGAATARRGWLEPDDVVNTLPFEKFIPAINAKRNRMLS